MQKSNKRKSRKALESYIETHIRPGEFDTHADLRRINGGSRLKGIFTAMAVYGAGFGLAWVAWSSGRISYEMFYKSSWVVLLPATVLGVLVWMISHNRQENLMRQRLTGRIRGLERDGGFLWRLAPLLSWARPEDYDVKAVVNSSRDGKIDELEPEDYATAVRAIQDILDNMNIKPVAAEVLQEVEQNITLDAPPQ